MDKLNASELLKNRILAIPTTADSKLIDLINALHPFNVSVPLIRIGGNSDGGYCVPNDLDGITACFSPGVADKASFEAELWEIYKIKSHLADFSVDGPPIGFIPASFTKKYVGAYDDDRFMTMPTWLSSFESEADTDLMLQMDIEGGEYSTLISTPDDLIKRFRIIILELHNLWAWGCPPYFDIAHALLSKLLNQFTLVHNHPNNNDPLFYIGDIPIPSTIELTFYRKDRHELVGYLTRFPRSIDYKNNPEQSDLPLPQNWHCRPPGRRLLLCRPMGGLNDQLCAIGKCIRYARKYDRRLVIDTSSQGLRDYFFRYFSFSNADILFTKSVDYEYLDTMEKSVYLKSSLNSIRPVYQVESGRFCDSDSGFPLEFDFDSDSDLELVYYQQGWTGGDLDSIYALQNLRLQSNLSKQIRLSLSRLPEVYSGIHVRNTDYRSDYQSLFDAIGNQLSEKILVCSDSDEVFNYAERILGSARVVRLSSFRNSAAAPLHYQRVYSSSFECNLEMFTDLFWLATSDKLFYPDVIGINRPSGFSLLAGALWSSKDLVISLLGDPLVATS